MAFIWSTLFQLTAIQLNWFSVVSSKCRFDNDNDLDNDDNNHDKSLDEFGELFMHCCAMRNEVMKNAFIIIVNSSR